MALKALQRIHAFQGVDRTSEQLANLDVAEITGRQIGQQGEAHVGRRGAVSEDGDRMFLEIVRR